MARALRGDIPQPSSRTVDEGVRMVVKRGFEGEASQLAKRGVTFHRTAHSFVLSDEIAC